MHLWKLSVIYSGYYSVPSVRILLKSSCPFTQQILYWAPMIHQAVFWKIRNLLPWDLQCYLLLILITEAMNKVIMLGLYVIHSKGRRNSGDFSIHFYYHWTQELYPKKLTFILLITCLENCHRSAHHMCICLHFSLHFL
jgi:hypothetical protein